LGSTGFAIEELTSQMVGYARFDIPTVSLLTQLLDWDRPDYLLAKQSQIT